MIKATTYNPATGQILQNVTADNLELLQLNLSSQAWIPGEWDSRQYYVQDNQAVPIPAHAESHMPSWQFDFATGSWIQDMQLHAEYQRQHRNSLLWAIDRVNPVWYAALTADQQAELQAYRQVLLAVPQQTGFPSQVEWPTKPQWL
jgi:hypothetical protein